ncbi:MAG: MFS transporter [Limibacillus sp.]
MSDQDSGASKKPTQLSEASGLATLILSAGILLAGNGLQVTMVSVRANLEGFPSLFIGATGTAYYTGFAVACFLAPRLIARAGHIRVFGAMAALAAISTLCMAIWVEPLLWLVARVATGFAFAGLSTVIESWLNARVTRENRARVFSIYRVVDLGAVTGAQFLLPLFGAGGFEIFAVVAVFFCMALIPISLSRQDSPAPPSDLNLNPRRIWKLSPLACVGCLTIGLTNGAFRIMGPVYATESGLAVEQVALFISAGIVGGAALQYPFGWLSDRFDRRKIVIVATAGATLAGLFLTFLGGERAEMMYLGAFLFGAFAIPLYSLSVAHANDFAGPGDYVALSATLTLSFALGAAVGPAIAGQVIALTDPRYFFTYTSVLHGSFILFVLYRMTRRRSPGSDQKGKYTPLLRTSPMHIRVFKRLKGEEGGNGAPGR